MQIDQVLDVIDRASAWAWIRRQYLPGAVICPGCGATITGAKALAAFERLERTYCSEHRSSFHPMAAIPMLRGTEWEPEEFVKLLLLSGLGQHPAYIGKLLGKSSACVRDMLDRIAIWTPQPAQSGLGLTL